MKNTPIARSLMDQTIREFELADFSKATIREVKAIAAKAEAAVGIGLIFIREVLQAHGCSFSLRTYADGMTRFRIMF